jgi:hypothetical protein
MELAKVQLTKKKEIITESYTFLDTDIKMNVDKANQTINKTKISNREKDILPRTIDSKKTKIPYKNRIAGGQNQQGHSSVYE